MRLHYTDEPPPFPDPYGPPGARLENFKYETDLHILRGREAVRMGGDREADYVVAKPYTVSFTLDGAPHSITVPEGMLTDLVSVPRPFRWLIERVGPHLEAAIVHDFLFIAWQDLGKTATRDDWTFSNRVMIAGLREAGVPAWMCWVIAFGLSTWFSWRSFYLENPPPRYVTIEP